MLVPMRSFAAALLSFTLAAGCASPGHVKAVKTADRLDHLSAAIQELRGSVMATASSLAALVARKEQDPASAFQQFEAAVGSLQDARRRADARLAGVHGEAEAYFVTWKEQAATIQDEDLKERSEERRTELEAAVENVTEALEPIEKELDTYLASLQDTLKYLSIDLTPQGIGSIEGRSKSAGKAAKSLDAKLGDALETVQEAAPLFARARAAAPKNGEADEGPSN